MGNISTTTIKSLYDQIDTLLPTGSLGQPYITSRAHSVLQRNIIDRINARIVDAGMININTNLFKHATGTVLLKNNITIPNSTYMVTISPYEGANNCIWTISTKTPTSFSWQVYQYRGNSNVAVRNSMWYVVINTSTAINDTINANKK